MARFKAQKSQSVPNLDSPAAISIINGNFRNLDSIFADRIEVIEGVSAGVSQTLAVIKSDNYMVLPVALAGASLDVAPEVTKSTGSFTVAASATATFDCFILGLQ